MLRVTLKSLAARWRRLVMTAMAIVLGVAFVTGVLALRDTSTTLLEKQFTQAAAGVDAVVRDARTASLGMGEEVDREPVAAALVDRVEAIEGVADAEGIVVGSAPLVVDGRIVPVTEASVGGSWAPEPFTPFRLVRGRAPAAAGEVVLDEATARSADVAIGETVAVSLANAQHPYTVVGTVGFGEADEVTGSTVALFAPQAAQELFGLDGAWSEIAVVADGISATELQRRLTAALGSSLLVATTQDIAAARADAAQSDLGYFTLILAVLAMTALIVGAFMIANTFAIVVAQRTRELATLRALGATTRSVTTAVVVEALLVGGVASVIGVGLGIATASGLRSLARAMEIVVPDGSLLIEPSTIAAGLVLGVGVTVLAALMPARTAARVPPVAAMRDAGASYRPLSRRRAMAGAVVSALGVAIVAIGGASTTVPLVGLGSLVALVGTVMLAPALTSRLSRAGRRLGRDRVASKLARANVQRAAQRTAATSAVLAVGLAVVTFMTVIATSAKKAVTEGLDEVIAADLVIEGPAGEMGGLSPEVYERIAALPGVAVASRTRHGHWRNDFMMMPLKAVDPTTLPAVANLTVVDGALDGLARGGVVVTEKAAAAARVRVGDEIEMTFQGSGSQALPVVAIISDDSAWPLATEYLISLDSLKRYLGDTTDATVYVGIADGADRASVVDAVEAALADFPAARLIDHAQLKAREIESFDAILGLVTVLLMLSVVIALIGIMNSLALSIVERTHEIGMLRAIGMTRRDVASMIRIEAVLTTLVGGLTGIALGLVMATGMVHALAETKVIELTLPVPQLVAYLAVAAIGGVLAGAIPGRRASRMDVLSAIATA